MFTRREFKAAAASDERYQRRILIARRTIAMEMRVEREEKIGRWEKRKREETRVTRRGKVSPDARNFESATVFFSSSSPHFLKVCLEILTSLISLSQFLSRRPRARRPVDTREPPPRPRDARVSGSKHGTIDARISPGDRFLFKADEDPPARIDRIGATRDELVPRIVPHAAM